MRITLDTLDAPVEIDVKAYVDIDANDLDTMYAQHPGRVAYIGELLAIARREFESQKHKVDIAAAEADTKIRMQAVQLKEKMTDKIAEKQVELNPMVQAAKELLIEKESAYKALDFLYNALRHRKDMLVSLGASQRLEHELYGVNIRKAPSPEKEVTDKVVSDMGSLNPEANGL